MGHNTPMTKLRDGLAIALVVAIMLGATVAPVSAASDSASEDAPGGEVQLNHEKSHNFYFWADDVELEGSATADYDGTNTPESASLTVEAGLGCTCLGGGLVSIGVPQSNVDVEITDYSDHVQYSLSVDSSDNPAHELEIDYSGARFDTGAGVWSVYQDSTATYEWTYDLVSVSSRT